MAGRSEQQTGGRAGRPAGQTDGRADERNCADEPKQGHQQGRRGPGGLDGGRPTFMKSMMGCCLTSCCSRSCRLPAWGGRARAAVDCSDGQQSLATTCRQAGRPPPLAPQHGEARPHKTAHGLMSKLMARPPMGGCRCTTLTRSCRLDIAGCCGRCGCCGCCGCRRPCCPAAGCQCVELAGQSRRVCPF